MSATLHFYCSDPKVASYVADAAAKQLPDLYLTAQYIHFLFD